MRPWKLATLAIGIGLLVVSSFYYNAPDWDEVTSVGASYNCVLFQTHSSQAKFKQIPLKSC